MVLDKASRLLTARYCVEGVMPLNIWRFVWSQLIAQSNLITWESSGALPAVGNTLVFNSARQNCYIWTALKVTIWSRAHQFISLHGPRNWATHYLRFIQELGFEVSKEIWHQGVCTGGILSFVYQRSVTRLSQVALFFARELGFKSQL